MNWPFVHRARLEAAEVRAQVAEHERSRVIDQLVAMTELVAEMKRAGFEARPTERPGYIAEVEIPRETSLLPPEVVAAISERAVEGTPMYRQLMRQAQKQLAVPDTQPGDVASWILRGSDPDEILYGPTLEVG